MPWTKLQLARIASGRTQARIAGMKIRARFDPPQPARGSFPYAHCTCAEWKQRNGMFAPVEMTSKQRRDDARQGSRKLRDAIRRAG